MSDNVYPVKSPTMGNTEKPKEDSTREHMFSTQELLELATDKTNQVPYPAVLEAVKRQDALIYQINGWDYVGVATDYNDNPMVTVFKGSSPGAYNSRSFTLCCHVPMGLVLELSMMGEVPNG